MDKGRNPKPKSSSDQMTIRKLATEIQNAPLELKREIMIRSYEAMQSRAKASKPLPDSP